MYLERSYTVVGVVCDGRAMVDEAVRLRPDVIIVDIGMPLLNGLDAARRIKALAPDIKFIFLTMRDDPNLAAAALELGSVAFVLKHSGGPELAQKPCAGETSLSLPVRLGISPVAHDFLRF